MNKHKNNKNGFHHIKLIIAELAFSSFFITLFSNSSLLGYWVMIVFGMAAIWFTLSLAIKAKRQIPTLLCYKDLASDKTKTATAKTKTAVQKTRVPEASFRYIN